MIDEGEEADIISIIMLNSFIRTLNSVPGNRIYLSAVMSFLVTFDRLHLYYFHHHNLSYYSNILLSNINTLETEKSSILHQVLQ